MLEALKPDAAAWVERHLERLLREQNRQPASVGRPPGAVVLALGAQGGVVLIGRGAGCILPRETTLHVRIVAPLAERIAYMSQWLRLTHEEAAERVRRATSAAPSSSRRTSTASPATCTSTTCCSTRVCSARMSAPS